MNYRIQNGDCRIELSLIPDCSIDSVVCDPPYELGFMGKAWDRSGIAYQVEVWRECLRVLKHGGHLLAFGGSRTYHRLACAIEDAGFEIRDQIQWIYGQGFPKSLDVSNNLREQGSVCICNERNGHLLSLQNGIPDVEGVAETDQDANLLLSMQRETARAGVGETWLQRDDSPQPAEASSGNSARAEEWRVEGRRDLLSETRKLRTDQIRSLPARVSGDGTEGRIRDGAPTDHGAMDRATANENGSSSPRRSQSSEQPTNQLATLAGQSESQTSGAWPLCGRCRKPMVPDGLGSALKPAHEPIVLARKPLTSTLIENVLQHGTGGLNIDGCRIETNGEIPTGSGDRLNSPAGLSDPSTRQSLGNGGNQTSLLGRWPANVIHDGSEEVLVGFPDSDGPWGGNGSRSQCGATSMFGIGGNPDNERYKGSGSTARFFYCSKASREDREDGCEALPLRSAGEVTDRQDGTDGLNSPRAGAGRTNGSRNHHPTVKPTDLMRYLCRLVTPPNGTVLDPFCGSGSTGRGAVLEGFNFIGIELDAEYCAIAEKRIAAVTRQGILTFA